MTETELQEIDKLLDAELQQELPEQVESAVSKLVDEGEKRLIALHADITPEGEDGDRWLLVTDRRLARLATENGSARVELDVPMDDIRRFRLRDFIGSGSLEAVKESESVELVRFSRSVAPQISRVYFVLRRLSPDDDQNEHGSGKRSSGPPRATRCAECGRALPRWSEVCPFCMKRGQLLARLIVYLAPYRTYALVGFLSSIVLTVLNLLPAYVTRYLFDGVLGPKNRAGLWVVVWSLLSIYVVRTLISMGRGYMMEWLGGRVVLDMRTELYDHLQMLSLGFFSRKQTGQIMSRVTNDIMRLQYFIADGLQQIIINLLTIPVIFIMLFAANPKLASLTLLPTPFIALGTYWFGKLIHRVYQKVWRRWAGLSAALADSIPGIRVVKSFAQEDRESARFRDRSGALFAQELNAAKLWTIFFPAIGLVTSVGSLVVYGYGGSQVLMSMTTMGTLVMFTQLMWQFYGPVQALGDMNNRIQHALTAAERVFEVLDTSPEIPDAPGSIPLPRMDGRVEFQNVSFSYEPGKPVRSEE